MFAALLRVLVGLCVALGLGIVPVTAAPAVAPGSSSVDGPERQSSQARSGSGFLTTVCIAKRSKRLSSPKSEKCGKGKTLRQLRVTKRLTACLTSTSVRAVNGPACRRLDGAIRRLPSKRTVTLCALGRSGDLRPVKRAKACTKRERVVRIGNRTPSNIRVTDLHLVENVKPGSVIGALASDDADLGDYARFRLVPGTGGDDNRAFALDGSILSTVGDIDFETKATYRIRVRARDVLGRSVTAALTLAVTDVDENNAPGAIALTPSSVLENQGADTLVGLLTTTDADLGDTHTYTLLSNDAPFTIRGVEVRTTRRLDREQKASYSLDIRSTDRAGESVTAAVSVTVLDVNEAASAIRLSNSEIAENNPVDAVVGTLSDDDPEGGTTYSLAAGAGDDDNAAFVVDGDRIRARHSFDFESQNSYSIRVLVDDGDGGTLEQAFVITVADVNEQPSDIDLTPSSIAENNAAEAAIGTLSAVDPDAGDDVTFELAAGGADNAEVDIAGDTLRAARPLDHETQGVLEIRVRAIDVLGASAVEDLTVTVSDVNEPATSISLSNSEIAENSPAGTVVGTLSDDDPEGGTTYSLASGDGDDDNDAFDVVGDEVRAKTPLDHEARDTYSIRVLADDGDGGTYAHALTIRVGDVNESPTDITLAPDTIAENNSAGALVGTLAADDPDAGDAFVFALAPGGDDNASFEVDGDELRARNALDYEDDASLDVRISVTDSGGESYTETLTVTVTDVNEAATYISLSSTEIEENNAANAVVGTLSDDDPEGGTTYSLVSGDGDDDNDAFDIVANEVRAKTPFDFESKDSYRIRVLADDGDGGTYAHALFIQVRDVNESPTGILLSGASVLETASAGTVVGRLTTVDPDAGESFSYELVSGGPAFEIVGDELLVAGPLNAQMMPTVDISVRVTDSGGLTHTVPFTIIVQDVNEAPTTLSLSSSSILENQGDALVGLLSATDPDGPTAFTFALASGAGDTDNGEFVVSSDQLRTSPSGLDFEAGDTRTVRLSVSDPAGASYEQAFVITVLNVDEAPTAPTPASVSVDENTAIGTSVVTFDATDPDAGETLEFSLIAGPGDDDNEKFSLATDGTLTTASALDHELQAQALIRVQVASGALSAVTQVTVTINDVNEVSSSIDLSPDHIAENNAPGAVVGTLAGNDPDAGDTLTYELVPGSGDDDNTSFAIDGDELRVTETLDRETAAQGLRVRVRVTDAADEEFEDELTVSVDNVNEVPTALTWADGTTGPISVDENQPAGTSLDSVLATDPDVGDTLTYTLHSGDTSRFTIDATTGELKTAASFDYEAIPSHSYSVAIRATDAGGLFIERTFDIDVNDVNDAPTAGDDAFTGAIGNTQAKAGTPTATGPTSTLTGDLPLVNDGDQDAGDSVSVVAATSAATTLGGRITITSNGHFTYLPPVGSRGVDDTYDYTVIDEQGATGIGTITITIGNRVVWYVDDTATAGGDGRSTAPLQSPAPLDGATGADQVGDQIYLFSGTYYEGIQLLANQRLTGAGVALDGGLLPAGATPTISVASGNVVGLANGATVEGIDLTATGSGAAIRADGVDSATVAGSVGLRGASGATLSIAGGGGTITIAAPIVVTSSSGRAVLVSGRTSGSVAISGKVTQTATSAGIRLDANSGSVVAFSGGVDLNTGSANGLHATGGGTVTVTGDGNRITSTTGTPLHISNTTIGAAGLRFESISSNGAASGVVLDNTGTSGSLSVTGTATGDCGASGTTGACTGGSIAGSTGTGVSLTSTRAPSLNRMRVVGSASHGIMASGVTGGLSVTNSHLGDNGNAGDEYGIGLANPAGAVVVDNTTVTGSGDVNVHLDASAGTSTVTLTNSRVTHAGAGTSAPAGGTGSIRDGLLARVGGTASVRLVVSDNAFSGNLGDHVQVASSGGTVASGSVISGNTLTGGTTGALGQGIVVNSAAATWTGTVKMSIDDNTITGSRASAISVSQAGATGPASFHASVSNNSIGTASTTCSQTANGITIGNDQSSTPMVVSIVNNAIVNCYDKGISMTVGDGASSVQGTVFGNTVSGLPAATGRYGFDANMGTTSADTGTSCLAVRDNTMTGVTGYAGLRIRHRYAALQLPGYTGGASDGAAVQAYLAARNTATAIVEATTPVTGTYANSAGCTAPLL